MLARRKFWERCNYSGHWIALSFFTLLDACNVCFHVSGNGTTIPRKGLLYVFVSHVFR